MRPASFSYQRPASVMEAVQLISGSGDAKLLAGGHSLLPAMKQRLSQPGVIVDIGRLDALRGISVNGNSLNIGALTTHAQVAASPTVRAHCRALAQACGMVGDAQVRNVGTLGGNLAHADPASDPPTVVLAAGGKLHAQGANGGRAINAGDFFVNFFTTDLQPGEILTSIELPIVNGRRSAYEKLQHPASRYAVTGVAVFLDVQNGTCTGASVAVGGATPKATRSPGAESALVGTTLDAAACDAAANALMSEIADVATGDIYAPADYRVAMAGVLLKRAISAAMQ
jgi:aerobic carbon-monoxide dehydrogenase medium subunit